MTESEAIRLMTKLGAFFPGTSEATVLAYASEVIGYPPDAVAEAVHVLARTHDRLPSLHQLLVRIREESAPSHPVYRALPPAERDESLRAAQSMWARIRRKIPSLPAEPFALPPTTEVQSEDEIAVDPEEVERKRDLARTAARHAAKEPE